jgi:large-conductance mechanosensitive channel
MIQIPSFIETIVSWITIALTLFIFIIYFKDKIRKKEVNKNGIGKSRD